MGLSHSDMRRWHEIGNIGRKLWLTNLGTWKYIMESPLVYWQSHYQQKCPIYQNSKAVRDMVLLLMWQWQRGWWVRKRARLARAMAMATKRRQQDGNETTTRRRWDDDETTTRLRRDVMTTRRRDDDETTTRRCQRTEEATGGKWMDSIEDTGELPSDNTAGGAERTRFRCEYVISNNVTHLACVYCTIFLDPSM